MPSDARRTLEANKDDLDRLMDFHEKKAGTKPGRKYNVEVLNKASVVLVCAAWEAYCEDVVKEAITHIVNDCSDITKLPKELKKYVSVVVEEDKHEHAPWKLAGDGWRQVVKAEVFTLVDKLNTPKCKPLKTLFKRALGIKDVTASWYWQRNTVDMTTERLDGYVTLRCEIAHRLKPANSVHKGDGTSFYDHACRLADKIDETVLATLKTVTGKKYW